MKLAEVVETHCKNYRRTYIGFAIVRNNCSCTCVGLILSIVGLYNRAGLKTGFWIILKTEQSGYPAESTLGCVEF